MTGAQDPRSLVADELAELGFVALQRRRDGAIQYGVRANAYLSYWVTAYPTGVAEMTWEFALGQYLRDKGLSVSGQDELSLLLFPAEEIRGTLEPGWVRGAVGRVEDQLRSLDFATGA